MNDLLLRTLRGETTERRPLWLMRQAGRFLPEYRALRAEHSFEELSRSPALAADVTLMPVERFELDAAIVFADLVSPLAALGVDFRFDPGPVMARPVNDRAGVEALAEPEPEAIAPEVAATLRLVKQRLDGRAVLIGFAGAPLSLAAYLVQGRGAPGFPALRALAASDELLFGELMEKLSRLAAAYALQQAAAGADVVQVFDSWGGILSLADWTRLVRPHLKALLEEMGRAGVPRVLFLHDAAHVQAAAAELPCEAVAVDWREDLTALHARVAPGKAVQGNLDPAVLLAGPEATAAATRALLARVPARGHVVNLGHGILPPTPLESVQAMIDVVHAERGAPATEEVTR